jgi:lipid-A-disaccharide synthase
MGFARNPLAQVKDCNRNSLPHRVFVVACEPSGDWLASQLIAAVRRKNQDVQFLGVGGPLMEAAGGFASLIPMDQLTVMGFFGVLRRLPRLLSLINQTVQAVQQANPCGFLSVDGPEFCLRVGRRVRAIPGLPIPRLHCVAPSVWAWRARRATTVIPASTDGVLSLFPFEAPYFSHMPYTFIGHPVLDQPLGNRQRFFQRFSASHGLRADQPLLCLLAGSRAQEIEGFFAAFVQTYRLLAQNLPGVQAVVVTTHGMHGRMRAKMDQLGLDAPLVYEDQDKRDAFAASTAALAASGTVTLELARAGTPMVVAYRVDAATAWILRRLVKLPHVGLINIVAAKNAGAHWDGKNLAPECLQDHFNPQTMARAVAPLLSDTAQRRQQIAGMQSALDSLWAGDSFAEMGAQAIIQAFGLPMADFTPFAR